MPPGNDNISMNIKNHVPIKRICKFFFLNLLMIATLSGCMTATLFEAAGKGKIEDAQEHLENGANINARAPNSATPLIEAVYFGRTKMVKFLLDKGANPDIANQYGVTPLIWSLDKGHFEITRLLLERGANPDCKAKNGLSPLIRESHHGNYRTAKLLLEHKANPDIQNPHMVTPLHWTAEKGFVNIARLLIDHGASLNMRNDYGGTPAFVAVFCKNTPIIKLLLENNADFSIPDKRGRTPLEMARQKKIEQTLVWMIEDDVENREKEAALAWNKATGKNTVESYRHFIAHYPYSGFIEEARKRQKTLTEEKNRLDHLAAYSRARPLDTEEHKKLLSFIHNEMRPLKIEKLLAGEYNQNPQSNAGSLSFSSVEELMAGKARYIPGNPVIDPGNGVLIDSCKQTRIENGQVYSISVTVAQVEDRVTQILFSKKQGEIPFSKFIKGDVGSKTLLISNPIRPGAGNLNDFRNIELFLQSDWQGEYINDGNGNWRKIIK